MIFHTTFDDLVNHGLDYLGGNPSAQTKRDVIRAVQEAYRDLANAFNWSYLYTWSRLITEAAYDSAAAGSTVTYAVSSGTYPNQLTISGDTWPTWAGDGIIRIGGITNNGGGSYDSVYQDPNSAGVVGYKVSQRVSATILTLDPILSPTADITTATPFIMYQDTYLLPEDFISQDQNLYELNFGGMQYTHPREWLYENRYIFAAGVPQFFTITGEQKYPGRLVSRMYPWPFQSKTVDFIYKRRPRRLFNQSVSNGTISITSGGNTVTGVGTTFTPAMVGSVLRVSSNTSAPSSLIMGTNVAAFQTLITAYASPTSVTIMDDAPAAFSGVGYTISDPADIEEGAMLNALLRCIEKHIGMARTLKDKPSAARQYDVALAEAKSADSRSFSGRAVGECGKYRPRFRDMPGGPGLHS